MFFSFLSLLYLYNIPKPKNIKQQFKAAPPNASNIWNLESSLILVCLKQNLYPSTLYNLYDEAKRKLYGCLILMHSCLKFLILAILFLYRNKLVISGILFFPNFGNLINCKCSSFFAMYLLLVLKQKWIISWQWCETNNIQEITDLLWYRSMSMSEMFGGKAFWARLPQIPKYSKYINMTVLKDIL